MLIKCALHNNIHIYATSHSTQTKTLYLVRGWGLGMRLHKWWLPTNPKGATRRRFSIILEQPLYGMLCLLFEGSWFGDALLGLQNFDEDQQVWYHPKMEVHVQWTTTCRPTEMCNTTTGNFQQDINIGYSTRARQFSGLLTEAQSRARFFCRFR